MHRGLIDMGHKKWPRRQLLYFLNRETIPMRGTDRANKFSLDCLISEESKQIWAWDSKLKRKWKVSLT